MAHAGTGAYGYGNVYRQYPQAQLQQVPSSPPVAIGPDPIRLVPPWEVETEHVAAIMAVAQVTALVRADAQYQPLRPEITFPFGLPSSVALAHRAAIGATVPVVYLVGAARFPVAAPAIGFPFLGAWWPHQYDAPDATVAIRNQLKVWRDQQQTGPAIPFPTLGQWMPVAQPLDESYYSFRIPLMPIVPPPPIVPPWWAEGAHWAALGAVTPLVYVARPQLMGVGGPAVAFPRLGQWMPTTQPLDESYYSLRQRLMPTSDGAVGPEAWARARDHSAALGASTPVVYLVDPSTFATAREAIRFPFPDPRQWWPHLYDAPDATYATRMLLERLLDLPVGDPPVAFPKLGQWMPTTVPLDESFYSIRQRLLAIVNPPPPALFVPPWLSQLEHWAAIGAVSQTIYLEQAAQLAPVAPLAGPPAWGMSRDYASLLTRADLAIFEARGGLVPVSEQPRLVMPWESERAGWAAIGHSELGLYVVRFDSPHTNFVEVVPAWESGRDHAAALGASSPVLQLARLERKPADPPIPLPSTDAIREHWAALNHSEAVLALVHSDGPHTQFVEVVPSWEAARDHAAALGAVTPVGYLARREVQPAAPAVPTSATDQLRGLWAALGYSAPVLYAARFVIPHAEFAELVPAWKAAREHLAAIAAANPALYLARLERKAPDPSSGIVAPWQTALANLAAIGHAEPALFLARREAERAPFIENLLPPWAAARDHMAAIGHAEAVVSLVRREIGRAQFVDTTPAWAMSRDLQAALGWSDKALYLVRRHLIFGVEAAPYIPSWAAALNHEAALQWVSQVLYLERAQRPNSDRPDLLPRRPPWMGFYERADDSAYLQRLVRAILAVAPGYIPRPPGLVGISMTQLEGQRLPLPPWVQGLIEDVDPKLLKPGTISEGENFAPDKGPRLAARGGSRIMLTLHDDAGSPAELTHVCGLASKAATGAIAVGWSSGQQKHYAYAVTSDMAFAAGTEVGSRTAFPGAWTRTTVSRPVIANLYERLYVCDATELYTSRSTLVAIDNVTPPAINEQTFAFAGGAAQALRPFCLEEYNNVLFIAGYGDESGGGANADDPALVRHSFLGQRPDSANGFDKDAYNTIGAKGDRVVAMKKGRGLLLVAKANELHRITGFGRAYPGWQYQVEGVDNTQGCGVENPLALEYAENLWFGIGKQGPFMCDGFSVDSLVAPRQRTWRGIDKLDKAFVRYHPERGLILFGVHVSSGAPDVTYPWVKLAWDIARRVWQPNWRLAGNTRFFTVQAVATTAVQGPTAAPSAPNSTAVTASGWTANWTNGDATAETEYWEKEGSAGSYVLTQLIGTGTALWAVTGRDGHQSFTWKVRHRKGGVFSDFSAEVAVQTLLAAPSVDHHCFHYGHGGELSKPIIDVTNATNAGLVTIVLERFIASVWTVVQTWTGQSKGSVGFSSVNGSYRAKCTDAAWPGLESVYSGTHVATC